MDKVIFLGNDLKIHTSILELSEGIYADITLDSDFIWNNPTEKMIAEDIHDSWTTLDNLAKDYISNYAPYKDYVKLIVVESKVDVKNIYSIDLSSDDGWTHTGTLQGYGFWKDLSTLYEQYHVKKKRFNKL